PVINIVYRIRPSGRLYLYTGMEGEEPDEEPEPPERPGPRFPDLPRPIRVPRLPRTAEKTKGLLRGYEAKWRITVRPVGGKEHVWNLGSVPLTRLTYDSKPSDPEWAPYAVLLHSGFYGLAGKLIGSFGLDPGQPPDTFTFEGKARWKDRAEKQ